jgi:hypothetical protein
MVSVRINFKSLFTKIHNYLGIGFSELSYFLNEKLVGFDFNLGLRSEVTKHHTGATDFEKSILSNP